MSNTLNIHFSILYSFEGRKKRVGSKEKLEQDKLQHKIKREMKGAIREIRKDNAFLSRQKIKEQIERQVQITSTILSNFYLHVLFITIFRDTERKRKVKELLGSLAMQEGEVNKMKKTKKKWVYYHLIVDTMYSQRIQNVFDSWNISFKNQFPSFKQSLFEQIFVEKHW